MPRTALHSHATRWAGRLVVERRDTEGLVVESLLGGVVEMVEGHRVDDLAHAELLDLIVCVKLEGHTCEPILDSVF